MSLEMQEANDEGYRALIEEELNAVTGGQGPKAHSWGGNGTDSGKNYHSDGSKDVWGPNGGYHKNADGSYAGTWGNVGTYKMNKGAGGQPQDQPQQ